MDIDVASQESYVNNEKQGHNYYFFPKRIPTGNKLIEIRIQKTPNKLKVYLIRAQFFVHSYGFHGVKNLPP